MELKPSDIKTLLRERKKEKLEDANLPFFAKISEDQIDVDILIYFSVRYVNQVILIYINLSYTYLKEHTYKLCKY